MKNPLRFTFWLLLLAIAFCVQFGNAGEKFGSHMRAALPASLPGDKFVAWIYFSDKGTHEFMKSAVPENVVSARSLRRRANVRLAGHLVDSTDLPLEKTYIDQVAPLVFKIRQQSKWLNAVSIEASAAQLTRLAALPFVRQIELVSRFNRRKADESVAPMQNKGRVSPQENGINSLDYGLSLGQLNQINVPAVHNTGNHAEGVLIGVFDNGFRLLSHEAFDTLRPKILATYDFVDHKVSVAPNDPSQDFGSHGINTLSTLAGYKPGVLIGPAFGADFILARTENDSSGPNADFYPSEEDNWIAAIEWGDSIGVQVTSTSLGYLQHLPPATDWTWRDMDGKTIPISRAATIAASKGIVVVNSAGNDAAAGTPNTLDAPADADSILTVGAVTPQGTKASFSSYGPTADGRIKPDVMAQGTSVVIALGGNPTGYGTSQGTSFSCPLAAGVAALVLRAHPSAKPMEILSAMKLTASNTATPNNNIGWGIINAVAAINYLSGTDTGRPPTVVAVYELLQNFPNPFNPGTTIPYMLPEAANVTLKIFNILGEEVRTLAAGNATSGFYQPEWDGRNNSGKLVGSGVYIYRLVASGSSGTQTLTRKMVLLR